MKDIPRRTLILSLRGSARLFNLSCPTPLSFHSPPSRTYNFARGTIYCVYSSSSPVIVCTSLCDENILPFEGSSSSIPVDCCCCDEPSASSASSVAPVVSDVESLLDPPKALFPLDALAKGLADPEPKAEVDAKGFAVARLELLLEAAPDLLPNADEEDELANGEAVDEPNAEKGFTKGFAGVDVEVVEDEAAAERPTFAWTAALVDAGPVAAEEPEDVLDGTALPAPVGVPTGASIP